MPKLRIPKWIREDINPPDGKKYTLSETFIYNDPRYKKTITIPSGTRSDGSSGGADIYSGYWGVHDLVCERGTWDDGTPITNWQASSIASYILRNEYSVDEKRWWLEWRLPRSYYIFWATFLFGGGKARDNGMFSINNDTIK